MDIRIGTSGFSYDDWKGHFYPLSVKRSEMLEFYARYFRTVEINSTYYGMPRRETMQQMTRRVPEGFDFVVKAHQDFTHSGTFLPESFAQFRVALEPLQEAAMLGGVLAQFPWSFRRTPENEQFLATLRRELSEIPVVVEFRNAEWVADETFNRLRDLRLGFCCVDEPRLKGLMPRVVETTAPVSYVRFHGRNAKKWWQHEHAYERYDYLYSQEQLHEWVAPVQSLAAGTERTYLFFNNHYEGQAGQNARQIAELLGQPLPWPAPAQETLDLTPDAQSSPAVVTQRK